MSKRMILPIIIFCSLIGSNTFKPSCLAAEAPPPEGGVLPRIVLPVPQEAAERQYLGIGGKGRVFSIPQIQAELVILEAFSMYCPFCQKEAPTVNELYQSISSRSDLKNKIKVLGVGVGNTAYEVNIFRRKYNVAFPLFPDPGFTIYDELGKVRTPYFIVIKINPDRTHKVVYSKAGSFGDPQKFIQLILERSDKQ
jgi:peroxiredoxin